MVEEGLHVSVGSRPPAPQLVGCSEAQVGGLLLLGARLALITGLELAAAPLPEGLLGERAGRVSGQCRHRLHPSEDFES